MIKGLDILHISGGSESHDCSAWRRGARAILSLYINTWWGSKNEGAKPFLLMPGDRTAGSGHRLEYRKFYFSVRNSRLFYYKCDQTLEQVAQRDCGISILGGNKTQLDSPEQPAVADSALSRAVG